MQRKLKIYLDKYNITHTLHGSSSSPSKFIITLFSSVGVFCGTLTFATMISKQLCKVWIKSLVQYGWWIVTCMMRLGYARCISRVGGLTFILGFSILCPHPMLNHARALPQPSSDDDQCQVSS